MGVEEVLVSDMYGVEGAEGVLGTLPNLKPSPYPFP